eukprot:2018296-Rhodomonas_salina.1
MARHEGRWVWGSNSENRTLVLTMCPSQVLEADTTYSITFNVTNPQDVQDSPAVSIAISGSVTVPLVAMDKPGDA